MAPQSEPELMSEALELTPPGRGVKFSVVDSRTGARSSIWRVWTGKVRDDIYLLETSTGGMWKVSHHNEWGYWRIAMTGEGAEDLKVSRFVVDKWPRPEPDRGWSEGVGVFIPQSDLRVQKRELKRAVVRIPMPVESEGLAVRLLIEEPGAASIPLPQAFPVAHIARPTGGTVYVVASPTSLGPVAESEMDRLRATAREERDAGTEYPGDRLVGVLKAREQRVLADLAI